MLARGADGFQRYLLLVANIGLYGVTAYSVVRRNPETDIRMSLGTGRCGDSANAGPPMLPVCRHRDGDRR